MTPEQIAAAAYISGDAIQSMVRRLEGEHALTLGPATVATIHRQVRLIVEPVVQEALAQEAALEADALHEDRVHG